MRRERRFRHRTRWQLALRYSGLPSTSRLVAWGLSTWWDTEAQAAGPSLDELAAATGLDVATVKRGLARLDHDGWVDRTPGGGRGRTTTYRATIPAEAEAALEHVLTPAAYQPPILGPAAEKPAPPAPVSVDKPAHTITETGAHDRQTGAGRAPFPHTSLKGLLTRAVEGIGSRSPIPAPWTFHGMTQPELLALPKQERAERLAEYRRAFEDPNGAEENAG